MYKLIKITCRASQISDFLNRRYIGEDIEVQIPCSNRSLVRNGITYAVSQQKLEEIIEQKTTPLLVICDEKLNIESKALTTIPSKNPRLDFINVFQRFFIENLPNSVDRNAIIEPGAKIESNVAIGAGAYIGSEVNIKNGTIIGRNTVIKGKVDIGEGCIVKDNSTIGSEGFGFEYNDNGIPIHFPQIGGIKIGNYVWIGSNVTIERPALDETIIENHVKIDDLVHIGHNCVIGERSLVIAGAILCGGVEIGKKCWISPNSTIKQKVAIGDYAIVGIGSVVVRDVPINSTVMGNPARIIKKPNVN